MSKATKVLLGAAVCVCLSAGAVWACSTCGCQGAKHVHGGEGAEEKPEPLELSSDQLTEFIGTYFSHELDATYRFSVVDGRLVVQIEQDPSMDVVPFADDRFEVAFHPAGWSEADTISLEFDRNRVDSVPGFGLSMGAERGIVFEKL